MNAHPHKHPQKNKKNKGTQTSQTNPFYEGEHLWTDFIRTNDALTLQSVSNVCLCSDEVGGDSCLILLLLCLVTVVISLGGTALYCTLVDTYSNICVDFYLSHALRFFEELGHWLPFRT